MPVMDRVVASIPQPFRDVALRHSELIKFAIVGATTMVFDLTIFYSLSLTVLESKPVVAKVLSGVLATILSYILNREWSFKNRGGRERHHEALLFFTISGVGVLLAAAPLWIANNVFDIREGATSLTALVIIDFVLNYIIGNLLQMAFRFWALRRFAFPDENGRGVIANPLDEFDHHGNPRDPNALDDADPDGQQAPFMGHS
ncbi:GtrA family protein [Rhodococcus kroppenstedtii]|nr:MULTISPECIES: GtrA family protein [Rhodococcus]MBT1192338.1 GtrA family protein [Rhodococcus kroppenstedtii]MDV7197378.1 GtrA family protein [Rhodococcus kroppenstedtii]